MKLFYNIVYGAFVLLLATIAFLYLVPNTPLTAHLDLKIVKSGSMEPTIMTGGLVAILPRSTYDVGDIVTFETAGANIPTTHRIMKTEVVNGETRFITKGDANEEVDTAPVSPDMILGKVIFDVPYVGFVIDFARQPVGFALLIVLPALLIIIDELEKIWRTWRSLRAPKRVERAIEPLVVAPYVPTRRPAMLDVGMPLRFHYEKQLSAMQPAMPMQKSSSRFVSPWLVVLALITTAGVLVATYVPLGATVAYYQNAQTSVANELRASSLYFSVEQVNQTALRVADTTEDMNTFTVLVTPGETSAPLIYDVTAAVTPESDADYCAGVVAKITEPFAYEGPLAALSRGGISTKEPWTITIVPPATPAVTPALCEIDVIYSGWDARVPYQEGYSHTERTRLSFSAVPDVEIPTDLPLTDGEVVEPVDDVHGADKPKNENSNGGNSGSNSGNPEPGQGAPGALPDAVGENNGHGNDADGNDDSNPGASNDPLDTTDEEALPGAEEPTPTPTEPATEEDVTDETPTEETPSEDIADPAEDFVPEPTPEPAAETAPDATEAVV